MCKHLLGQLVPASADGLSLLSAGLHKPKIWERDLLKTYEKMTGFTEAFAKKNYLRVVEKSQTYGYTMFPVKQTHMKQEPAKVCCCFHCPMFGSSRI